MQGFPFIIFLPRKTFIFLMSCKGAFPLFISRCIYPPIHFWPTWMELQLPKRHFYFSLLQAFILKSQTSLALQYEYMIHINFLPLISSSFSALPAVHWVPHNLQWPQEQRASSEVEPSGRIWTVHTEGCPFRLLRLWPPLHKLHRAHGPPESPHREETLQVSDLWCGLQQVIRAHPS